MAHVQGTAQSVRIEQEGPSVVLRFVVASGAGERIPVEMRGRRVLGVLEDGDEVRLEVRGRRVRGRGGVARPRRVMNQSTASVVRVARRTLLGGVLSFVGSVILSALSGWLSSLIVGLLTFASAEPVLYSYEEGPEAVAEEPLLAIPLLIGLGVAALVFFLVWVRPRLRR